MKKLMLVGFLMVFLSMPAYGVAADTTGVLTNESIIKMVTAGLPEDVIISQIETSETKFDLSVDGILNLKAEKISDNILRVMQKKTKGKTPAGETAQTSLNSVELPAIPANGNFFLLHDGKLIEIKEHTATYKRAVGLMLLTGVDAGATITIKDEGAPIKFPKTDGHLVLLSRVRPDPTGGRGGQLLLWAIKKDSRYLRLSARGLSGRGGRYLEFDPQYVMPFDFIEGTEGIYIIKVKERLEIGEYAFLYKQGKQWIVHDFAIVEVSEKQAGAVESETETSPPASDIGAIPAEDNPEDR